MILLSNNCLCVCVQMGAEGGPAGEGVLRGPQHAQDDVAAAQHGDGAEPAALPGVAQQPHPGAAAAPLPLPTGLAAGQQRPPGTAARGLGYVPSRL